MTQLNKTPGPDRNWIKAALIVFLAIAATGIMGGFIWGRNRLENALEKRIDRMAADYSLVAAVEYEDVNIGFFGRSIQVSGIRIAPVGMASPYRIGKLVIHRFDHAHRVPRYGVLSAESVEIPGVSAYLDRFGLALPGMPPGKVTADIFVDYRYDPETRTLTVRRFSARIPDAGTLSAAAAIGNIVPENAAMYLILPYSLLFEGATLVYSDDGLVSRWMTQAAARKGLSPDVYARSLNHRIADRAMQARQAGEAALADSLEAVTAFLNRPQSLSLTARPEHPVPFGRLMAVATFEEVIELFDVRVAANAFE